MIAKLIAWSIKRRELVALGAIFVLVAGVFLLRTMPVDAIPDLSDTQVIVYTDYPGQAPQVVEDQVTYPLLTTFLAVRAGCGRGRESGRIRAPIPGAARPRATAGVRGHRAGVDQCCSRGEPRRRGADRRGGGLRLRDSRARLLPWGRGHREGRGRRREGWAPGAGRRCGPGDDGARPAARDR